MEVNCSAFGVSLVDAAVRAAVAAHAPRRSVAATAAAVATAVMAANAQRADNAPGQTAPGVASKRRRKRKKRVNKADAAQAGTDAPNHDDQGSAVSSDASTNVVTDSTVAVEQLRLDSAAMGLNPVPLPINSAESIPRSKMSGVSSIESTLGLTPSRTP